MKKFLLVILILVIGISVSGCTSKEESKVGIVNITYAKFQEKLKNKEMFFVEIIKTGCPACESFSPKLQEALEENNLKAYQINISNLAKKDYDQLMETYKITGTPHVLFFNNGEETSALQRITSNISKTELLAKLKANGYINEKDS